MDNNYKRDELRRFTTVFTEEAIGFLNEQEPKAREKILSNIRKAEVIIDNDLFKKINDDVWEFRTLYKRKHYRLLAFWDKELDTMVICTHGTIKKDAKLSESHIKKVMTFRYRYMIEKKTNIIY